MPTKMNTACPDCLDKGIETALIAGAGLMHICANGHKFPDLGALRARGLKPLGAPPPLPTKGGPPPIGAEKFEVVIRSELRQRLQQRFGIKLEASVASLLGSMTEEGSFIVAGAMLQELRQAIGQEVASAQGLVAILKNQKKETAESMTRIKEMEKTAALRLEAAPEGARSDGYFVKLDENHMTRLREVADFRGCTAEELLAEQVPYLMDQSQI